jgi:hypothetical protein
MNPAEEFSGKLYSSHSHLRHTCSAAAASGDNTKKGGVLIPGRGGPISRQHRGNNITLNESKVTPRVGDNQANPGILSQ